MDKNDSEILNASHVIDLALEKMNKENRGEEALNILNVIRNLNDHIALKIWRKIEPDQTMDINKVAKKLITRSPYNFIGRFDKYLRKSVSHFTPNEDGAERLSIKYFPYLKRLKITMQNEFGMEILKNLDRFITDKDSQTQDYYDKIADAIIHLPRPQIEEYDNYYIYSIKPFFSKFRIFYEVTLEPADEKPNKFNRITAFCKGEFIPNYCTALSFEQAYIHVFDCKFPINIITGWKTSIRPCEVKNFAKLLGFKIEIKRSQAEYDYFMDYLTKNKLTLLDVIDFDDDDYKKIKDTVNSSANGNSKFFRILDVCREVSVFNQPGKNILRYLLCRMNNRIIKMQNPSLNEKIYVYGIPKGCQSFDELPLAFNPKGHRANFDDILESTEDVYLPGLLAKVLRINLNQEFKLYTSYSELKNFGSADDIKNLVNQYNSKVYSGFKPDAEIGTYKDYLFIKGDENVLLSSLKKLLDLAKCGWANNHVFSAGEVEKLENAEKETDKLNDPYKKAILTDMFSNSRVRLVYGAAGTGKSTLINFVARLTSGYKKVFLSKTNPAKENLRHRITYKESGDIFLTIDSFKSKKYDNKVFDIIVVDECSTVKNDEIYNILNRVGSGVVLLVGDIYQIQAIGFGNWFSIAKNVVPSRCCGELYKAYRSTDEELKALWKEVRELNDDNLILEDIVRNEYSHPIDSEIFDKKDEDEIILCLNYNGLYGLNNINKLMQNNNRNEAVSISVWQFKVDDPILFNDSERFEILYNNLKGRIVDIRDYGDYVRFFVKVFTLFSKEEVEGCEGLTFVGSDNKDTIVSFDVTRRPPYSSDEETEDKSHILPFEIAYAVSIHKSQGLEYESVKIVIADDSEDRINHSVFYTAITRAKRFLTIYWSPEVCNRVIKNLKLPNYDKDYAVLNAKYNLLEQ